MADRNGGCSSPRAGGGSEVSQFADFSSFREMMQEERETAAAEQRRLMAEVYELKFQLAEERRSRPGVVQNGTAAVQSGTTGGGGRITNPGGTANGLDDRMHIEPMRWMGSKPQRAVETVTAELCRSKVETVRLKSNRSKMFPCSMVLRPSFQLGSRIVSAWPSFMTCLGFLLME